MGLASREIELSDAIRSTLVEARTALESLLANAPLLGRIEAAAKLLATTFSRGGRVFSCGNGGSMCDAMHFAEELSGRYRNDRKPLPAASISDASHISCVGNDYGYEHVFARYLEAHARAGDVLLAISTSGKSGNVLAAARLARETGVVVIGMTGNADCPLAHCSDILLDAAGGRYADRVQELHIKIIHILIEMTERQLFPGNYA